MNFFKSYVFIVAPFLLRETLHRRRLLATSFTLTSPFIARDHGTGSRHAREAFSGAHGFTATFVAAPISSGISSTLHIFVRIARDSAFFLPMLTSARSPGEEGRSHVTRGGEVAPSVSRPASDRHVSHRADSSSGQFFLFFFFKHSTGVERFFAKISDPTKILIDLFY